MTNSLNTHKVGLTLGGMAGLGHVLWSALIALELAQSYINWILQLHMIRVTYTVLPFSLSSAVMLVVVTSIIGYIVGYVFGTIWNAVQKA